MKLRERPQPHRIRAGAEARRTEQAIPVVGGSPDEQRLDCLDRPPEESDARGPRIVGERLRGESASFDDHDRAGKRLIALADHANGYIGCNGPEWQQRRDRRGPRRDRQTVRIGEQPVGLDDQVRRCSSPQPLRPGLVEPRHHDLVEPEAGSEGLGAAEPNALDDFHVLHAPEVLDHLVHGLLRISERLSGKSADADDVTLGSPAGSRGRQSALRGAGCLPRARAALRRCAVCRCRSARSFLLFLSHRIFLRSRWLGHLGGR